MNKHQKLVQAQFLNDEEIVIKNLKTVYKKSLSDITGKISVLDSSIAQLQAAYNSVGSDEIGELAAAFLGKKAQNMTPEDAKATLQSMLQSKIYQKKYQEALEKQVSGVLDTMHIEQFKTVSDYLEKCYENGFVGTMYDLHGQGIPLIMPIDQEAMVMAIQLDSKISHGLYSKLGVDVNQLKVNILANVSRGISSGMTFQQVAQQIDGRMNISYNNAIRIARTEGHRIQVQSAMNACYNAKDKGADVVKQWDSTLDGRTRESHAFVDGEIRELDEKFSNGLMFPGDPSGPAEEVINCRCALFQRARWALDEDELETLKERAEFYGLDKSASFDDFKKKYLEAAADVAQQATKKTYLTKKKLEQLISDGELQMDDLKKKFADNVDWPSYDEFYKDFKDIDTAFDGVEEAHTIHTAQKQMKALEQKYGGYDGLWDNGSKADQHLYGVLDDKSFKAAEVLSDKHISISSFGTADEVEETYQQYKKAKAFQKQIDKLQAEMDEWQEKLDKKIIAAETKKLKKVQIDLQDQIDGYEIKTYSNIWKDDVTTEDWFDKQSSIQAKKKYFQQKLAYATDQTEIDKWQGLLDDLDDFDKKGSALYDLKSKRDKAEQDLKKLLNGGKISAKGPDDAFSDERKSAALWFDKDHGGFRAADKYFDPPSKAVHGSASSQEQRGFYTYTSGSGGHNRPLAGFQKPWSKPGTGWEESFYVGPKKVWIDFEGKGDQIRGLTSLIQRSVYDHDVWLQSGQGFATLEGFLGIPYGSLSRMSESQLQQFVGVRSKMYSFISTAVNEGGGSIFNGKPMKINFYAPKGSQMLYASDVGAFGKGENEMILQRGGTYEITRIYWGTDATDGGARKLFVDMEIHPEVGYDLFQQDQSEWTGSRKNYRD